MLVVDDPLHAVLHGFLKIGNVDAELVAEGVGFGESVGGDSVFVTPVVALQIVAEFALLFDGDVDEVGDRRGDSFAELLGEGSFAMSEVGEESEAGHGDLMVCLPSCRRRSGFSGESGGSS